MVLTIKFLEEQEPLLGTVLAKRRAKICFAKIARLVMLSNNFSNPTSIKDKTLDDVAAQNILNIEMGPKISLNIVGK